MKTLALFSSLFLSVSQLAFATCGPDLNIRVEHPLVRYIYKQIDDSKFVAQASRDGNLVIYDYKKQTIDRDLGFWIAHESHVLVSNDGKRAVIGTPSKITIFDIPAAAVRKTIDYKTRALSGSEGTLTGYAGGLITRDNRQAFLVANGGDAVVVDLNSEMIAWSDPGPTKDMFFSSVVRESPDGRYLAGSRVGPAKFIYDRQANKGDHISTPGIYDYGAFDATSKYIVYMDSSKRLVRYEIASGKLDSIAPELNHIERIESSPDFKYLVLFRSIPEERRNDPDLVKMYLLDATTFNRVRIENPSHAFKPYMSYAILPERNSVVLRGGSQVFEMDFERLIFKRFALPDNFPRTLIASRDGQSILGNDVQLNPTVSEAR